MCERVKSSQHDRPVSLLVLLPIVLVPTLILVAARSSHVAICTLQNPCMWPLPRPLLANGAPSSALFDAARRYVHDAHAHARVLSARPLVLQFDAALAEAERVALMRRVDADARTETDDVARKFVHVLSLDPTHDALVWNVASRLARDIGLPHADFAEVFEIGRFDAQFQIEPRVDFLTHDALQDGPFRGCQRVAGVLVFLSEVQSGGEMVFLKRERVHAERGERWWDGRDVLVVAPKMHRMVAWFNVDPMTEEADEQAAYAWLPVQQGRKYVLSVSFRNCSREDNAVRLEKLRRLEMGVPHPSISVNSSDLFRKEKVFYDDFGQFDDEDDDDDEEEELKEYTVDTCAAGDNYVVDLGEFYDDYLPPDEDQCMWWEDPVYGGGGTQADEADLPMSDEELEQAMKEYEDWDIDEDEDVDEDDDDDYDDE